MFSILVLATLTAYAQAAGVLNATAYYRSYEAGSSIENSTVQGSVSFLWSPPTGVAIVASVSKGLTEIDASYPWHIHVKPVPSPREGVDPCTKLGDKLNPSGTIAKCDPASPNACIMGDLSGKWGAFKGNRIGRYNDIVVDDTLRFWPEDFSILGRSFAIHKPDGSQLACGNITSFIDGTATADGIATGTVSTYQTYPESIYPALVGEAPIYKNIYDMPDIKLNIKDGTRTFEAMEPKFTYVPGLTIADFPKSGNAAGKLSYEDPAAPVAVAPVVSASAPADALLAEPSSSTIGVTFVGGSPLLAKEQEPSSKPKKSKTAEEAPTKTLEPQVMKALVEEPLTESIPAAKESSVGGEETVPDDTYTVDSSEESGAMRMAVTASVGLSALVAIVIV